MSAVNTTNTSSSSSSTATVDTTWAVEWLVYQLTDSLLPTGGFVCSSGLEAAAQHGWVYNESTLMDWCEASVSACARASLPFLDEAYRLALYESPSTTNTTTTAANIASSSSSSSAFDYSWCTGSWWNTSEIINDIVPAMPSISSILTSSSTSFSVSIQAWRQLVQLDDRCDACMTTTVARKSSQAQGRALITAYVRCFAAELEDNSSSSRLIASQGSQHAEHMARQFLNGIRRGHVVGHLPVTFGISCAAMGLNLDRARHLFLFLYARNLFSSAVRLNLVGPYRAQRLLQRLSIKATEVMQQHAVRVQAFTETNGSIITATAQTAPLLDLYQGAHDRLYSRLFHS